MGGDICQIHDENLFFSKDDRIEEQDFFLLTIGGRTLSCGMGALQGASHSMPSPPILFGIAYPIFL